jgi:hypothetical protein
MLLVVVLLPLSSSMYDDKFNHGGGSGGGGGGGPAAAAAAALAAMVTMDNDWRQKRPATRAVTVPWKHAMTKADGGKQRNNQPTKGSAKAGGGGWQQRQRYGAMAKQRRLLWTAMDGAMAMQRQQRQ